MEIKKIEEGKVRGKRGEVEKCTRGGNVGLQRSVRRK